MVILTIKNQDTFEFYGYEAIVGLSASKHGDIWVVKKWGEHAINWRITTPYYLLGRTTIEFLGTRVSYGLTSSAELLNFLYIHVMIREVSC